MRILLSAFACDPVTGSEPYVGWNWATRLNEKYDLAVLTRTYSERLIRQAAPDAGIDVLHFDLPGCSGKDHYWKFIKPYYVLWQFAALFYVLALRMRRRFDVIHHLTYNVVDMPGLLALVPGARFIWGPVGGGQVPPPQLRQVYGQAWPRQKVRSFAKRFSRLNPLVAFSVWRAAHVFFANRETAELIARYCRSWSLMLETAIDPPPLAAKGAAGGALKLLWLGNVIDRKALIIAIEALGRLCDIRPGAAVELVVAGDGPMLQQARDRAAELGLVGQIRFCGRVPFEQVMGLMENCDVFLFTSVQDTSGNVLLEAMSRGKPVICLDHQGAAEIVDPGSGIKIPVAEMDEVARGFAQAIAGLADDPDRLARLGEGAYRRIAEHHRWDCRMAEYDAIVRRIA